jgi:hydroxymethylglutaryl-CoA lyase
VAGLREILVYEVGPRDGLQNESKVVPTADKLALITALVEAGIQKLEATSFVSPKWIPPLADAAEVARALPKRPGVTFSGLVPNEQGLANAQAAGMKEIAVFLSASETHNKKNINKSIDETLTLFERLIPGALGAGMTVRGYLSTVWGCPYEGAVDPGRAVDIAGRLVEMGCYQVSLGDTVGIGTPGQTREIVSLMLARLKPPQLALHMHDTRGTALANVLAGLDAGLSTFDAAIGGLGGCPYAPGASGNLATEDLVYMLQGMGHPTGIDFEKLVDAGALAQRLVGRELPGRALRASLAQRQKAGRT